MKFGFTKAVVLAAVMTLAWSAPSLATICGIQNQVYCQEWDGTGQAFSSQNDVGGLAL